MLDNKFEINLKNTNASILALDYLYKKHGDILEKNDFFCVENQDDYDKYGINEYSLSNLEISFCVVHKEFIQNYKYLDFSNLHIRKGWSKLEKKFFHSSTYRKFYFKPETIKKLLNKKICKKTYDLIIAHYFVYKILNMTLYVSNGLKYNNLKQSHIIRAKKSIINQNIIEKAKHLGFKITENKMYIYFDMQNKSKEIYTYLKMLNEVVEY